MTLSKLLQRQKELSGLAGGRAEALHLLPPREQMAEEAAVSALYVELFDVERTARMTPAATLDQVVEKLAIGLRYATDELSEGEDLDANWLMVRAALEDLEVLRDEVPLSLGYGVVPLSHHQLGHVFPGSSSDAMALAVGA